jgi:hypothetical protein
MVRTLPAEESVTEETTLRYPVRLSREITISLQMFTLEELPISIFQPL